MKYNAQQKYWFRLHLIQFMIFMPTHPEINDIKEILRGKQ